MQTLHLPLLHKREIAHDTYAFVFPKPKTFRYQAGQYISLSVEEPNIAAPNGTMRELSLVSAPYEDTLEVAIRYRASQAKKQYLSLREGEFAYVQGPFGSFHLDETETKHVLLAGGIGIVPFLSLIKQSLHEKKQYSFFVFFANRNAEDIPYLIELQALAKTQRLTLINTLTRQPDKTWDGESGYISPLLISKYITPLSNTRFYISGPMRFVGGMWEVLEELGISDQHIHGEEFTGY